MSFLQSLDSRPDASLPGLMAMALILVVLVEVDLSASLSERAEYEKG
jgi:hypothetical protein